MRSSRQCGARIPRQQANDEIGEPVGGVAPAEALGHGGRFLQAARIGQYGTSIAR